MEKESTTEEKEKGDGITIALPSDNGDDDKVLTRGEIEVDATAATLEYGTDDTKFAK